jgi:Flp pilus assembly protein TadG
MNGPTTRTARGRSLRRGESGAVALISGLVSVVLLVVAAFVVDLGGTWARRGHLQVQADNAALFAAEGLPATDSAKQASIARRAAWYIACHPVQGQKKLTPAIPACPGTSSAPSAALDSYAAALLADGLVTFPDTNQVSVTTPPARVDFAFGQVAGAAGTTQQKTASARVLSPGELEPLGLSLNCLLTVANNLPASLGSTISDVLPLNYFAPGPLTKDTSQTRWRNSLTTSSSVKVGSITPTQVTQGTLTPPTFTVTGSGWNTLSTVKVSFALGDTNDLDLTKWKTIDVPVLANDLASIGLTSTATGVLPSQVVNNAGNWHVKVAVMQGGSWVHSQQDVVLTTTLNQPLADSLGCGRILKSPRNLQDGTPGNLRLNLQESLDHGVTKHPSLATLNPPDLTVPGVLSALGGSNGVFQCNDSGTSVKDTAGNLSTGKVPNCMVLAQGSSTYTEFTDGMLAEPTTITLPDGTSKQVAGRLVCTAKRPCARSFTMPQLGGRQFNDDRFEDFVTNDSLLNAAMFFNLSTYVDDGAPVLTPKNALDPAIYGSARFFWVPVLSTALAPNANANDAGAYPVLTFRPVFITQQEHTGVSELDLVLDAVDTVVKTLLNIDDPIDPSDPGDHGVLMQGTELRALRFMTIEPSALPAVPTGFSGPTSDYLGVGPKIVKLVR